MKSITEKIIDLGQKRQVIRPSDIEGVINPGPQLRKLVEKGVLLRIARGLYTLAEKEPVVNSSLIQATARVPGSVLCLISALEFHGFTTQIGYRVWLAVGHKGKLRVEDVPVRLIRMSAAKFEHGVEEHVVDGHRLKVFGAAKTVADCFAYRSVVGLEVAMEALREGWRERKFTVEELVAAARVDRVEKVMRPYMEATLS